MPCLTADFRLVQANHNDLDAGSFVFEMAGHRWASDLGADSYGLPGYFTKSAAHGKRYSYYRKSTRGHNTLTFDGRDEQPGWCMWTLPIMDLPCPHPNHRFPCSTQHPTHYPTIQYS